MGDRSMKSCLEYHLEFIREHLVHAAGTTPQAFYDGGQDWEALDLDDVVIVESLAHSWGYLEGAADMADLTIVELLDQHGLQLDEPKAKKRKSVQSEAICPKCESKQTHRCKTGDDGCWHCDDCEHSWLASKSFSRAKGARS